MAFWKDIDQIISLLTGMGLNEYQALALSHLLLVGEAKATAISKASGIPLARIYDVLDELSKMGLVLKRPGRPVIYKSRSPEEIINLLMAMQRENLRRKLALLEDKAKNFLEAATRIYLKGKKVVSSVPLLRIVTVGTASLEETRNLYNAATKEILILSKAMEYFPHVSENLKAAQKRGVSIRIILMNPELMAPDERTVQAKMLKAIKGTLGTSIVRFADDVPIRGSIIDPETGLGAIFLVEDPGVPFFLREAAVTSHRSVVKGLALMFNLVWKHFSKRLD